MHQSTTFHQSRNIHCSDTTVHISLNLKSCISAHIERDMAKLFVGEYFARRHVEWMRLSWWVWRREFGQGEWDWQVIVDKPRAFIAKVSDYNASTVNVFLMGSLGSVNGLLFGA